MDKPRIVPEFIGPELDKRLVYRIYDPDRTAIAFDTLKGAMHWCRVRPDRQQRREHISEWLRQTQSLDIVLHVWLPDSIQYTKGITDRWTLTIPD